MLLQFVSIPNLIFSCRNYMQAQSGVWSGARHGCTASRSRGQHSPAGASSRGVRQASPRRDTQHAPNLGDNGASDAVDIGVFLHF